MSNPLASILNSCAKLAQRHGTQPCLLCAAPARASPLCPGCLAELPRLPAERCPTCALPTPGGEVCGACLKRPPAFVRCHAVFRYAFPADVLIQRLKFGGELALAGFLADCLAEEIGQATPPDLLLPMPLHPRRLGERGFNQAVEISRALSRRLGIPLALDACRRERHTPAQAGLDLKARRRNLRRAFACEPALAGLRVALLDDVMTSGTSLDELARAVRRAGAAEVEAWVVARTLRDDRRPPPTT